MRSCACSFLVIINKGGESVFFKPMKARFLILIPVLLIFTEASFAQESPVKVIGLQEFSRVSNPSDDTTYVFNFWATWCIPCVKELPDFLKLEEYYRNQKFKLILISLDFKKDLNSRLIPFLKERNIGSTVMLFSEPDPNSWIPKIHEAWSGAIPATLIVQKNKRVFRESSLTFDELIAIINPLMLP